ncbi:MAG: hypothetical protein K2Y31_12565 [Burkholderiales bacterium]|jgi:hypothetical protein|nr:hypothetical protein [Burkholderiales bacterium]
MTRIPAVQATRHDGALPQLELSGPKLAMAFERLANGLEECGGIERHVEALKAKSLLFSRTFLDAEAHELDLHSFKSLCALISTVRRRVTPYVEPQRFGVLRAAITGLLDGRRDTTTTDSRMAAFRGAFPEDREHRWVHDLAAEILHNIDPERYPMMLRWVWDTQTNTGVIREIWHAENGVDVDQIEIRVPSNYATYLLLREELSQFLADNGVFRDVIWYVDLLTAQIYADYVGEQGGVYLRADFSRPEDPLMHLRRLLGLDGIGANGQTRLKSTDGSAFVVEESAARIQQQD